MTEKKFNIIFNAFILIGMIVAVVWVNVYKLQEPDVQVVKQIVVAVGAVMGVVNTVLTANGSIWTFLFGIFDVLICSYANYDSGNIGLFLEHLLYFLPMQFVGLWQWRKRGAGKQEGGGSAPVKARRLDAKGWALSLGGFVIGTVVLYFILLAIDVKQLEAGRIVEIDRAKIALDSAVVIFNILGQVLMSLAYAEQWYFWIGVNVFSICLWTNRMFSPDAGDYTLVMLIKYCFYLLNSLNGIRIWLKLSREGARELPEHNGCC